MKQTLTSWHLFNNLYSTIYIQQSTIKNHFNLNIVHLSILIAIIIVLFEYAQHQLSIGPQATVTVHIDVLWIFGPKHPGRSIASLCPNGNYTNSLVSRNLQFIINLATDVPQYTEQPP